MLMNLLTIYFARFARYSVFNANRPLLFVFHAVIQIEDLPQIANVRMDFKMTEQQHALNVILIATLARDLIKFNV